MTANISSCIDRTYQRTITEDKEIKERQARQDLNGLRPSYVRANGGTEGRRR